MKTGAYRIEWRPMAREDLRAIIFHIGKDSPIRAQTFGQELQNKTSSLISYPELGRQTQAGSPSWLRELVVHKHYIVFYRILPATRVIEILRIKHAARQMPSSDI